jgi:hypothetical protein
LFSHFSVIFWALIICVPSDPRFVNLADNSRNLTPTIKTAGDNAKGRELPNSLRFLHVFHSERKLSKGFWFHSKRKFAIKGNWQ